jgi:Zn-dependent protease
LDSAFNFGKFFGIQFKVHYSWFFIFGLITFFLAGEVFPGAVRGQSTLTYWLMAAATAFLFFVSVLFHETGHSLVGRANGIPVSSITLFLFGGAAQMTREPASAAAELKMASAGPAASLVLAGVFWLVYIVFLGATNTVAAIALWLAQINLIVAVFNMLPGFPLDGGRVLRGLWWHFSGDYVAATRVAVFCGRVAGFLIIGAGVYFVVQYRDWLAGVWLAILGWYLENSARLSLKQFRLQLWMKGKKVADVMERDCPVVGSDLTLAQVKQLYPAGRCFRVMSEGRAEAVVFLPGAADKPDTTQLSELALPLKQAIEISPDADLLVLAQQMNETGKDFAVVKEGGVAMGMVFLDTLIELVNRSVAAEPPAL